MNNRENTITTDRLHLRPLRHGDAEYFLKYLPDIDKYLALIAPKNMKDAEELVESYLEAEKTKTAARYAIEEKATREFVGVVGAYELDSDWPEQHLWIRKESHGKGYAFEAMRAFMKWANKNLDYTVIHSSFDVENVAMKKLNEKLGGIKENDAPEAVLQKSGKTLNILSYAYYKPSE